MAKSLGANFDNGEAYILDPTQKNRKIPILLDSAHILKLARNCIGSRNLVDSDGGLIKWRYLELLYEAQKNLPYNLGNKLTKAHMQWESKKMCVKLAAQTLSKSVADSLNFLKEECSQFEHAGPTSKYVNIINDIFDVMNSSKLEGATGFKRALTISTCTESFDRFDEAMDYLKQLKVEGDAHSIFLSKSRTPFIGFYNNMANFKRIFKDYVISNRLDALVTHRFSQDHLEAFFSCIRSLGGECVQ